MTPEFSRYGVYLLPETVLFGHGSAWLGWDCLQARPCPQPDLPDLPVAIEALTRRPRRYGFHGTIKPPFALADGTDAAALDADLRRVCADFPAFAAPRLTLHRMDRIFALTLSAPCPALHELASAIVSQLDHHRAPPSDTELARRRKYGLTARQDRMLRTWGYPFVGEEFAFHITLTGPVAAPDQEGVADVLQRHFAPHLGSSFPITSLALVGEASDGAFHVIARHKLRQA